MTKKDIIELAQEQLSEYPKADVAHAIDIIFDSMKESLLRGERIEIRDFGVFLVKEREPRIGRNPKTGDQVQVPGKRVPFFKVGKELKKMVDHQ